MSDAGHGGPGAGGEQPPAPAGPPVSIVRLVLVGLVDALLIWALASAATSAVVAGRRVLRRSRSSRSTSPISPGGSCRSSSCCPGILFLIVFQLYTMAFTAFSSFTNYGTGHLDDKHAAIIAIQAQSVVPVEGGREYQVVPIVRDGTVSMLIVDPDTGQVSIGTNDGLTRRSPGTRSSSATARRSPASRATRASTSGTLTRTPTTRPSGRPCSRRSTHARAATSGRSRSRAATEARPGFVYDEAQDAMVDTATGEVFPADESRRQLRVRQRRSPVPRLAGHRRDSRTTSRWSRTRACDRRSSRSPSGRSSSPSRPRSSTSRWA